MNDTWPLINIVMIEDIFDRVKREITIIEPGSAVDSRGEVWPAGECSRVELWM